MPRVASDEVGCIALDGGTEEDVVVGIGTDSFYLDRIDVDHMRAREPQVREDRADVLRGQRKFPPKQHVLMLSKDGRADDRHDRSVEGGFDNTGGRTAW